MRAVSGSVKSARVAKGQSDKEEIVRKTGKILCQMQNCECTLQTLVESLKKNGTEIKDYTELTKSLEDSSHIFVLSDTIGIKATVNLCEEFQSTKTQCTKGVRCNSLHICKFYLLSDSCTFHTAKRPCIFGHNIEIPHNKKILRSFCLDQLDVNDIRNILKCPRNRTPFTIPQLCNHYQRNNCKTKKKCRYLHLCREYLSGTCKRVECHGHDVFDNDAANLLKSYGFEMGRDEKEIIDELRSIGLIPKVFPKATGELGTDKLEAGERMGRASTKGKGNDSKRRNSRSPSRQTNVLSVADPQNQMQPPRNQQNMPYQPHGQQHGQMQPFLNQLPEHQQYSERYPGPNYSDQYPQNPNQCDLTVRQPRPQHYAIRDPSSPPNQWSLPWPQNYPCSGPPHPYQWNAVSLASWQQPPPIYPYPPGFNQGQTLGPSNFTPPQQNDQRQQKNRNPQKQKGQSQTKSGEQSNKTTPKQPEKESEEICLFNFRKCFRGDDCNYHHRKVMFQWQYKVKEEKEEDQPWRDFDNDNNTELEKAYSDPNKDTCPVAFRKGEIITVNYEDMTGSSKRTKIAVRRLSTPSSESPNLRPPNYKWSTVWKWFWQNEPGTWTEYGEKDPLGFSSFKNSEAIEKIYLASPKGSIEFATKASKYKLDMNNMVQINANTSVKRPVRRRPKFFTKEELKSRPIPVFMDGRKNSPRGWSIGQVKNQEELAKHYAEIKVDETSEEYKKVSALFYETPPTDTTINSVERIENGELWISFDSQREKMKRTGGTGTVEERSLFHGTTQDKIEAICRQGFDPRFSGFRVGAIHGRGSYFAKEAQYSHSYAENSDQAKKMFVVRVLVGEFTKGDESFVRPPAKSAEKPHDLYNTCVDNISDPKIFVVFTLDQAYPEYIITYT